MQKARRYQSGRKAELPSRSFGNGVLCALCVSVALWSLLLLLISLVEWLVPNIFGDFVLYIVAAVPIISMGVGTYLGTRRIGRMAVWIGGINGIACWLISLCVAWCGDVTVAASWMMISAGICLTVSIIGALLGVLCAKQQEF